MKKLFRKLKCNRGFSFLEVLIALGMMGIVTTAVFKIYINQHKNYLIQDDVTNIQQNARASIDEIARNVRMAGYDLPDGLDAITASNTNPDTITLNYRIDNCDTYLSSPMPQPSAELKCATDVSCFTEGDYVYIYEPDSGGGEWFEITAVQEAALHIQHNTMSLSKTYGADALVLSMHQAKFYLDMTTDPDHPTLMVKFQGEDAQIYAENIDDLQFQYVMKNGATLDVPTLVDNIREILITVRGRSDIPDVDSQEYRNRTFSTSVNVRNLGS